MASNIIDDFVADYQSNLLSYVHLASFAEGRCRSALNESGIPAIITARAKNADSLRTKLRNRDTEKHYQSAEEILLDLVDLVGVRIALYFPGQQNQVEGILHRVFQVEGVKRHDKVLVPVSNVALQHDGLQTSTATPEEPYTARFHGYRATHFRVKVRSDDVEKPKDPRQQDTMIEIQVASVLMHAWSEVNHDLAYKTLNGHCSNDELRMLDGINGLVLTGEVLLTQLKASLEARISLQQRPFLNYFELGAFIQGYAPYQPPSAGGVEYRMGSLSWLLYVLRHLGIDNPQALGERLERWSANPKNLSSYPLAQSILVWILAEWDKTASTAPTLERPFLHPKTNDKLQSSSPAEIMTANCHILAYACSSKVLLPESGDRDSLPASYESLSEKGYLIPESELSFPSGQELDEVKGWISDLWEWFVSDDLSTGARAAFGIARAREGNKYLASVKTISTGL